MLVKNKILSLCFMLLGLLSSFVDGDATFFVISLVIGVPAFFAKYPVFI